MNTLHNIKVRIKTSKRSYADDRGILFDFFLSNKTLYKRMYSMFSRNKKHILFLNTFYLKLTLKSLIIRVLELASWKKLNVILESWWFHFYNSIKDLFFSMEMYLAVSFLKPKLFEYWVYLFELVLLIVLIFLEIFSTILIILIILELRKSQKLKCFLL